MAHKKKVAEFHIGFESVDDYLRDLERRWGWGVKLSLGPRTLNEQEQTGTLWWTVSWNLRLAEGELIWVEVAKPANLEQDPYGIAADLWDLLYEFDRKVEKEMGSGDS